MFPDLTKSSALAFFVDSSSEGFQTLHNYNLARGLPVHTRFDDLHFVSRSQICQNHADCIKLQIAL